MPTSSTDIPAAASEERIPYAAYPFGGFVAQSLLGAGLVGSPPRERSGTA